MSENAWAPVLSFNEIVKEVPAARSTGDQEKVLDCWVGKVSRAGADGCPPGMTLKK